MVQGKEKHQENFTYLLQHGADEVCRLQEL